MLIECWPSVGSELYVTKLTPAKFTVPLGRMNPAGMM
jgi:hypothetical protein